MQREAFTYSGAIIRYDDEVLNPVHLEAAALPLGGILVVAEVAASTETALQIMDRGVVGTTLTDSEGTAWELWPSGWVTTNGGSKHVLDPSKVVAATMPGGWAWNLAEVSA
jgi:hypothetical protein